MQQGGSRVWVRIGSYLLAGGAATLVAGAALADAAPQSPGLLQLAAGEGGEGGEGGEAGEGGAPIEHYSLSSTDPAAYQYEAREEIAGYADLVHESYRLAHLEAVKLQAAVDALLATPDQAHLAMARNAWLNARPAYLETEAFRFYDGPIDVDPATGGDGPEGGINAWPLNEAFIDYVEGNPGAGLVNDTSVEISEAAIRERDQATDEADVTTGWHAIEFLLWGQDLDDWGPGARPATDYEPGVGNNDRRRAYLKLVTDMLVADLAALEAAWAPEGENYRKTFLALEQREAVGRMLNGMAQLAGFEMASERLAVALDSGMQEDEHSCFSDNTYVDHLHDLRGIRNLWFGQVGGLERDGVVSLVAKKDATLAARITLKLGEAEAALLALDRPFDRILASPPDSAARQEAEVAITRLTELAELLKEAGGKLGVLVVVGG